MLAVQVLNHRCAQHQDEHGVWNKYGGRLDWDSRAIVGERVGPPVLASVIPSFAAMPWPPPCSASLPLPPRR